MFDILKFNNAAQKGATLVELLVVLAITCAISLGISNAVFQMMNINNRTTNHIAALEQVQNAITNITRDIQMTQTIQTNGGTGFPVNLTWREWDSTYYQVSYSITNGNLIRVCTINQDAPSQKTIARNINIAGGQTSCAFSNGIVDLKITATAGSLGAVSETRLSQIIPRPIH